MKDFNDEQSKEDFLVRMKEEKSRKQNALDESFKRAEVLREKRKNSDKTHKKKPFLKSGILFIIISIIVIGLIYQLPWMYIKYESIDYGEVSTSFKIDFENTDDLTYNELYPEIKIIFSDFACGNCSNYSRNYLGIISDDFSSIPEMVLNGFFSLIIISFLFTLFQLIDRKKQWSIETSNLIHSFFAVASIIPCVIIFFYSMKFIGSYFLFFHNSAFISALGIKNVVIVYIVPIILVILSLILIRVCLAIIVYNYKNLERRYILQNSKNPNIELVNRRNI